MITPPPILIVPRHTPKTPLFPLDSADGSYPKYTAVLLKALDIWYYDPSITTPILKLMAELVQNKTQASWGWFGRNHHAVELAEWCMISSISQTEWCMISGISPAEWCMISSISQAEWCMISSISQAEWCMIADIFMCMISSIKLGLTV